MPFWKRGRQSKNQEIEQLAVKLVATHCDRTDDAVSWAKRIASQTMLDEGQVFWAILMFRLFWVRTGAMLHMTDARPLIDKLHWWFLEGIRTGCNFPRDHMAKFEQVMSVSMSSYTKAFNETEGSPEDRARAVAQELVARLSVPAHDEAEFLDFLQKQAERVEDVRMSVVLGGLSSG